MGTKCDLDLKGQITVQLDLELNVNFVTKPSTVSSYMYMRSLMFTIYFGKILGNWRLGLSGNIQAQTTTKDSHIYLQIT